MFFENKLIKSCRIKQIKAILNLSGRNLTQHFKSDGLGCRFSQVLNFSSNSLFATLLGAMQKLKRKRKFGIIHSYFGLAAVYSPNRIETNYSFSRIAAIISICHPPLSSVPVRALFHARGGA
jgi:hypothetical protein